ncbi:MAG: hypothetical protein AAFW89_03955 [Bacteroidota bacterium]
MLFLRVISTLEELIFQFAVWLILLPKTIRKVLFRWSWAYHYVKQELEKEQEARFQDHLSPILFWVIVAVIPFYALGFEFFQDFFSDTKFGNFKSLGFETTLFGVACLLTVPPLVFAVRLQRKQGEEITYTTIRDTFYTQIYIAAPAQIISGLGQLKFFHELIWNAEEFLNTPSGSTEETKTILWFIYAILSSSYLIVWFIQEVQVFKLTLGLTTWKAVGSVILTSVKAYSILFGILILLLLISEVRNVLMAS